MMVAMRPPTLTMSPLMPDRYKQLASSGSTTTVCNFFRTKHIDQITEHASSQGTDAGLQKHMGWPLDTHHLHLLDRFVRQALNSPA
jgi:hypothetical protein